MNRPLENRVAIITGANQGLGFEIARKYVQAGASLAICARNGGLLNEARDALQALAGQTQRVIALVADVSREYDVRELTEMTVQQFGRIDILVNNAGIYGPKGEIESVDWEEWTRAIEINLYGSILMCRAVVPYFKIQRYGKIVQLSGGGATNPLPRISAYAVSKAAVVRFAETLAEEVRSQNIDVNAIAPGALNTRMLNEVLEAGPEKVGKNFYEQAIKQQENGGAPIGKGAELAVFLASAASDGITGKGSSVIWDPWEELPSHLNELEKTDIYTLRRIVPRDRHLDWGNRK